jgi:hypothetical protein
VKRLKGPELKVPTLKVPSFLGDLYHDLRDRRLLPLVALVLVAIAATPILLGQHSETAPSSSAEGGGPFATLKEARDRGARLTVVQATPGLRDYRKRLRDRSPTDPFRKTTAKPDLSGAQLGGGAEGGLEGGSASSNATTESTSTTVKETSTTKTTESTTATNGSGGGVSGAGSESSGDSSNGTLYTWAADLTIVHSSGSEAEGNKQSDPPMKLEGVLGPTTLPSEKIQVVTYLGRSPKTHRAVFLVSSQVTGVFGEGKCAAGTGSCQLIELETGFPEVFEYGEGTDRYSVKVTKLESVPDGHA